MVPAQGLTIPFSVVYNLVAYDAYPHSYRR
jgi:hypothetical protein